MESSFGSILYNHETGSLSELDLEMISHLPPGGNWSNIPSGLSARVDQIKERSKTKGLIHTTYYGRLKWDAPSYTISTYYTRPGNGCHVHPEQDRVLSDREAARLQSFPDHYKFMGTKRAIATQIGNAVPPLLAAAVAKNVPGKTVVDLFAGAGGLSLGLELSGKEVRLAVEQDNHAIETYRKNHAAEVWQTSISSDSIPELKDRIHQLGGCDIISGGPPCQSFSTAGNRAADHRSTLVNTFADVVTSIMPMSFIMENVHGLKSFAGGRLLEAVNSQFKAAGYHTTLLDLKAEQYGVPQRRRRVFLIGSLVQHLKSPDPISEVYRPGVQWRPTVWDAIGDLPPLEPGQRSPALVTPPAKFSSYFQDYVRGNLDADMYWSKLRSSQVITQPLLF